MLCHVDSRVEISCRPGLSYVCLCIVCTFNTSPNFGPGVTFDFLTSYSDGSGYAQGMWDNEKLGAFKWQKMHGMPEEDLLVF